MNRDIFDVLQNAYPTVHERMDDVEVPFYELTDATTIDAREVFDHIRDIRDPEHPLTLEQLGVVDLDNVKVDDEKNLCFVEFTPTIPHCSMATLIGLSIKVHLLRILPPRFKIDVRVSPGTHSQETAINKQLSDKERIAAALENRHLLEVINDCLMLPEEQDVPKHIEELFDMKKDNKSPKLKYILRSRQPVKSYRRWHTIMESGKKGVSIFVI